MDYAHVLLTSAVGAALGEALLGKRLGNRGLAWGAALALAPVALDFIASLLLPLKWWLGFEKTAFYSLAAIGAAARWLPRWLAPKWKRAKIPASRLTVFCAAIWAAAPLCACLSAPGVNLLWPLPLPRVTLNALAPADAGAGIILGGLMLSLLPQTAKKQQAKRRRLWWWGTSLALAYVGLFLLGKAVATRGCRTAMVRCGLQPAARASAMPTAWNPLLWRCLADGGDTVWLGSRSVWQFPSTPMRWIIVPRNRAAFEADGGNPVARRLAARWDGWWVCRGHHTGLWLADPTAGWLTYPGGRKGATDLRFRVAWNLDPTETAQPLRMINADAEGALETVNTLIRRSFGASPAEAVQFRLAGIPGSLPEPLATTDGETAAAAQSQERQPPVNFPVQSGR